MVTVLPDSFCWPHYYVDVVPKVNNQKRQTDFAAIYTPLLLLSVDTFS